MINIFLVQREWVFKMIEEEKILLGFFLLTLKRCAKVLTTFKEKLESILSGHSITTKQKE
jgi:hypothetical protein